jgi:hypothetical protein
MSNVTTLSDGRVGHDQLRVELVEAGSRPPHVRITWPPHATVTTVAQLAETLAAAMRILANASTELNRRVAQQKGMRP